jgi:hypothetical protein
MSSNVPQQTDNQEIDLGQISKKVSEGYESFLTAIFRGLLFLKRNLIWIVGLFVIGAGLGFYLDKTTKVYDHKLIVTPNFSSSDYLYAKVEQLNAKIKEKDTVFFKKIGIQETKKFGRIEIEPIIDVYRFMDNKEENFELIKLMAEDGSMDKILKDKITSKNYPFHMISYTTENATTEDKTLQPILNFLNESVYYKQLQTVANQNIDLKMKYNEQMLTQIDGILSEFSSSLDASALKSDRLVYYNNENTQLNDVLKTKEGLIFDQSQLRIQKINTDKIIKDLSYTLNVKNTKAANGKLKFILPILFVLGFIIIRAFFRFYRRQQLKMTNT